jgi:hypothetical protein
MYERDGATLRGPSPSGSSLAPLSAPIELAATVDEEAKQGWAVPRVGFIMGMPGSVMEAGEAKVPGGYSEMTYSLPRWEWIDRTRMQIIASDNGIDYDTSIGNRMHVPIWYRLF